MVFSSMSKSWLRAGGCEGFLQLLWESITWFGEQLTNRQIATSIKYKGIRICEKKRLEGKRSNRMSALLEVPP